MNTKGERNAKIEPALSVRKELKRKVLGRTGLEVGIVGLGTAFLGVPGTDSAIRLYLHPEDDPHIDEELAVATVIAALESGVSLIDTAPKYVDGRSELIIAKALTLRPELARDCIVTTKVGYYPDDFDYSYDMTMRCFEASQKRLQKNQFPIVYIHDPMGVDTERVLGKGGTLEALRKLQSEGSVKFVGIAADDPEYNASYIETGEFDVAVVPTALSLLNHLAFRRIIPAAERHNVGLVIGTPVERGLLITGPRGHTNYLDRQFSQKAIEQTQKIQDISRRYEVSLAAVALQWCTMQSQVGASIPGAASPEQARQNTDAGKENIPEALWQELERILKPLDPKIDLGISYNLE